MNPLRSFSFSLLSLSFSSCSAPTLFSSSDGRRGYDKSAGAKELLPPPMLSTPTPPDLSSLGETAPLFTPLLSSCVIARASACCIKVSIFLFCCLMTSSLSSTFLASLFRAIIISFSLFSHCLFNSLLSSRNSLPSSSRALISSTSLFIVPSKRTPSFLMMTSASLYLSTKASFCSSRAMHLSFKASASALLTLTSPSASFTAPASFSLSLSSSFSLSIRCCEAYFSFSSAFRHRSFHSTSALSRAASF
mmetsp:Transcript_24571/g.51252  ORF Transcript_24571/g.51252 Transcript_24571/m.51252 type:complete len:249 (-) Transcript_24571:946-1692(-)